MKKYLKTTKLIQQMNGLYKLEVYDGGFLIKEEQNLEFHDAVKRIDQIMEEGRNATEP